MLKKNNWLNLILLGVLLVVAKAAITDKVNPSVTFKPPSDNPKPEKTALGGRRTNNKQCIQDTENDTAQAGLTALVPIGARGSTTLAHPTFWVYLPETTASQIVLSVMEENKGGPIKNYSQASFPIPPKPGLVSLKLPDESPSLELGKTYKWAVILEIF